jgi:small subunit ribosomal protein S1
MSRPAPIDGETGWAQFIAAHQVGDVIDGHVVGVVPFGSFVRTAEGVDGFAPLAEFPAQLELDAPVRVRVTAIDAENRRFSVRPAS